MEKPVNILFFTIVLIFGLSSCKRTGNVIFKKSDRIFYNQVGYQTNAPKIALIKTGPTEFVVINENGDEAMKGLVQDGSYWEQSGDTVSVIDFTNLTLPGKYTLILPENNESAEIIILDKPFMELSKSALKSFYYNRSGTSIDSLYGGVFSREAGHPDTVVFVHSSAVSKERPENFIISSPLGWYDAGDYNKYVVNSGITTYTLLRALVDFEKYFEELNINIPESNGPIPDLLAEILYNLRWVLTMQDPNDGGVYHKLTTKQFEGFVMPHLAVEPRYVVQKSTTAALNYAALLSMGYRTLKKRENQLPGLAGLCLKNAEKAWDWAVKNPNVEYNQPKDIGTGAYGDKNFDDEWFWCASELFLATGKKKYLDIIISKYSTPQVPTWNQTYSLGFISLLDNYNQLPEQIISKNIKQDFLNLADNLVQISKTSPYRVSIQNFNWGSNSDVANHGMLKLFAYKLTGNKDYLASAISDLDYILGRNATGYCFVTGFGQKKVMNIHHRPSGADGIVDPIPGFLVGGPNLAVLKDCGPDVERSPYPAKSFVDLECSYSTNEIAINWNAPLVYLVAGIDVLF